VRLLTDGREDVEAFKIDFERACLAFAKAIRRGVNSPDEAAAALIGMVKGSCCLRFAEIRGGIPPQVVELHLSLYFSATTDRRAATEDTWWRIELWHALDWLKVVVGRWLERKSPLGAGRPATLEDRDLEMFMGIAQRVADEVTEGRYSAPDED
jgi:hypothetical protein